MGTLLSGWQTALSDPKLTTYGVTTPISQLIVIEVRSARGPGAGGTLGVGVEHVIKCLIDLYVEETPIETTAQAEWHGMNFTAN